MISATLNAYANELGKDPDTIRRAMSKSGFKLPKEGEAVRLKVIFDALNPKYDDPKQRLLTAQAEAQERENLEAKGRLVEWDRVESVIQRWIIGPMIGALDNCKDAEFVKSVKALLRQKLDPTK